MQVVTDTMYLFWMPDSIFSNWHPHTPLTLNGYPEIVFENSEAAFMFLKAKTFGDSVIADAIVANQDPKYVKSLGRRINGFTDEVWAEKRYACMLDACFAKFHQNGKMGKYLLATGDKSLVEASPYDKVWGIGLAPNNPDALDPTKWRGLNLLGEVLMDVRTILRSIREKQDGGN